MTDALAATIERRFGPQDGLPVSESLPSLRTALAERPMAALSAPPGSGKTLLAPAALLPDFANVWVLEPRRVTARLPALSLREVAGDLVGYRIRLESLWARRTRLGYLTYGTALRTFLGRPPGPDDLVVFDEFHERTWEAELLLAFLRGLEPAPRLLLMSATLDRESLPEEVPVIRSDGRLHPVTISWETSEPRLLGRRERLADLVARRSREWAARVSGEQLIFLPGLADIRAVEEKLRADGLAGAVDVLHSTLPEAEIRRVVERQATGFRRILSTDIAESSVTLPGVEVVIDAGLVRRPIRDELDLGVTLLTVGAPRSALQQRAGRAGRLGPGYCHRLFTRQDELHRPPFPRPEMERADYKTVALFLASAGKLSEWRTLPWLYPPGPERLESAVDWCRERGLLQDDGLTQAGRTVLELPLAPRLGSFALKARAGGLPLERVVRWCQAMESPPSGGESLSLLDWTPRAGGDGRLAAGLTAALGRIEPSGSLTLDEALLLTFSDTVAELKSDRAVSAHPEQPALALAPKHRPEHDHGVLLAASPRGGAGPRSLATLFHPVPTELIWERLFDRLRETESLQLDREKMRVRREVRVRVRVMLGQLVLERTSTPAPPGPETAALLLEGLREQDLGSAFSTLGRRLGLLFEHRPDLLEELAAVLGHGLTPGNVPDTLLRHYLETVDRWGRGSEEALLAHAQGLLPHGLRTVLDRELPVRVQLPGRRKPAEISYPASAEPYLAGRLQDFFGWSPPALLGGRVKLVCHLLAPNGRPCQITTDLESFWRGSYQQVRKDLRGRYPKHDWPENPG